jgi:chromosome segregation ATPase
MNPRQSVDTHLAQARDEVCGLSAVIRERKRELRELERRFFDARARLQQLVIQASTLDAQPGVH